MLGNEMNREKQRIKSVDDDIVRMLDLRLSQAAKVPGPQMLRYLL